MQAERSGVDTAVHILLDCSYSMIRRLHLACCACYALASALEGSKINIALTVFPSSELPDGSWDTVAPLLKHGQKVSHKLDLIAAGGTPMGQALWWVMQEMQGLQEQRKIILIVTDGEPDCRGVCFSGDSSRRNDGFLRSWVLELSVRVFRSCCLGKVLS